MKADRVGFFHNFSVPGHNISLAVSMEKGTGYVTDYGVFRVESDSTGRYPHQESTSGIDGANRAFTPN